MGRCASRSSNRSSKCATRHRRLKDVQDGDEIILELEDNHLYLSSKNFPASPVLSKDNITRTIK